MITKFHRLEMVSANILEKEGRIFVIPILYLLYCILFYTQNLIDRQASTQKKNLVFHVTNTKLIHIS